jgi:hypothetical protein
VYVDATIPRIKLALTISALVVPVGAIIGVISMWALARYRQAQFEKLSVRVSALQVGKSTFTDVEELRGLYKREAITEDPACTPASCEVRIGLHNFLASHDLEKPSHVWWSNQPIVRRLGIRPSEALATIVIRDEKSPGSSL